jgi:hypothetical protein
MSSSSLRVAVQATLHCLTGCATGEVLGSIIGSVFQLSVLTTEFITIPLAFLFGYAFTMRPLLKHSMSVQSATKIALASDTLSIATMEVFDTLVLVLIPGAVAASLTSFLFWGSLAAALVAAFIFAVPVNYLLIRRGLGHALVHKHHRH